MTAAPYRLLFDHALRRVDPEQAHRLAFGAIRAARPALQVGRSRRVGPQGTPVLAMGLEFPSVLGLAAGFDKSAVGVDALAALGFGHVEIGTVTAWPQPGNPRPRLFRLPADRAIVNRMGFNNDGATVVAARLAARRRRLDRRGQHRTTPVLGVNIGKSRVVAEDDRAAVLDDYATSARLLAPYADYLAVNVSSPNTPGLRELQAVERLAPLLGHVRAVSEAAAGRRVPLAVKVAPDLADADLTAVADLALDLGLEAVIATNTTTSRGGLSTPAAEVAAAGPGGLSGPPLRRRALEVTALLRRRAGDRLTIIGVGGISTPADARARVDAGADLLQAYTAFVYEGPAWPRRIVEATRPPVRTAA